MDRQSQRRRTLVCKAVLNAPASPKARFTASVRNAMTVPKITLEQTRGVAQLARLALSESELEVIRGQLDSILKYMAELETLDIVDVEPTFYSIAMEAPLRADITATSLPRDEALRAAPEQSDGAFAVPKIME